MIAIGFVLVLIGIVGGFVSQKSVNVPDWLETIFAIMFCVGVITVVSGVVVFMWRYLP